MENAGRRYRYPRFVSTSLPPCPSPLRPLKPRLVNRRYFYKAEKGTIDRDGERPSGGA